MPILCEITCIFNFYRVNLETQPRYLVFSNSLSEYRAQLSRFPSGYELTK